MLAPTVFVYTVGEGQEPPLRFCLQMFGLYGINNMYIYISHHFIWGGADMLDLLWTYISDTMFGWVVNLLEPLCAKGGWREKLGLTLIFLFCIACLGVTIWFANR